MAQPSESERLLDFVSEVTGDAFLKVEESLGDGFVRLKVGEAQRRQARHDIRSVEDIVIELLRNSRDAGATCIFVAFQKERDNLRRVTVIDNGCGIPEKLLDRVFEPRVTSKLEDMKMDKYGVHGRGMALYSVRSTAKRAHIPWSSPGRGCALSVTVDLEDLPERKDQSTWPKVRVRGGSAVVRGPHNVPRLVTEFKLEHPDIELFIGSPAEVLSTMRRRVLETRALSGSEAGGEGSATPDEPPTVGGSEDDGLAGALEAIAAAADARGVREAAESRYGIAISERSAQRVLSGRLAATEVLPGAQGEAGDRASSGSETPETPAGQRLARRLSEEDLSDLSRAVARALETTLSKYFISVNGEPRVSRNGDEIRVWVRLRPDAEP